MKMYGGVLVKFHAFLTWKQMGVICFTVRMLYFWEPTDTSNMPCFLNL
jgi:hypothetical protein